MQEFVIRGYKGIKFPTWAELLTASLPYLVKIDLENFDRIEILPSLSQLRHLKYLKLKGMPNVEFLENDVGLETCVRLGFFPSLENLELSSFPKLKGWWKEEIGSVTGASSVVVPSFSRLHDLVVNDCPRLTILPPCPSLKSLLLFSCNEALTFLGPSSSLSSDIRMLYKMTTDNPGALECLFGESFAGIHCLCIQDFEEESLLVVAEKYVSSIEIMEIYSCLNLRSLSRGGLQRLSKLKIPPFIGCKNLDLENNDGGMTWKSLHLLTSLTLDGLPKLLNLPKELQYLTSLKRLYISWCDNLDLENSDEGVMPWKSLQSLSSLTLELLPKMLNLPKGLQHLTSLQELEISRCSNLEALPEWLNCLSSLKKLSLDSCFKLKSLPESIGRMPSLTDLTIIDSEDLEKRCREPDGEDWHKIRHIIRLSFKLWRQRALLVCQTTTLLLDAMWLYYCNFLVMAGGLI